MATPPPSDADVRAELARVLASPGFRDAGRLGPFLRHLVERTLEGETDRLKESVLGVEVFQRPADYDPRTDPIVRVEARRLRARLEEHYSGLGAFSPLRLHLPKGGYIPEWTLTAAAAPPPPVRPSSWSLRKSILIVAALIPLFALAALYVAKRAAPAPTGPMTVAVLPFRDLNPEDGAGHIADGLTEELIDRLARLPELKVAARSLTAGFREKAVDLHNVALATSARIVIEGSVRRQQGRLRISARVVDANHGATLWSETYDRPAGDIFAIQDEIAASVANALRVRARPPASSAVPSRYTTNLDAYQSYLRARQQANRYSAEGMELAARYYREALALQQDYAPALAGLGQVYALAYYYNALPPGIDPAEPRRLAERAIALDPNLAEAHATLGMVLGMNDHQWPQAEAAARRAIELNPASADAHGYYAAAVLLPQGRFPEALAAFRRSLELEPQASFINFTFAFALLASGDTTAAIEQYRRTLSLQNIHPDMEWDYGMALGFSGRHAEAAEAFFRARRLRGEAPRLPFGIEALLCGQIDRARADAPRLEQAAREGRTTAMEAARLLALLGETEEALDWLERAARQRETQVVWLKVDPRLRSLRNHPRLTNLAARYGL